MSHGECWTWRWFYIGMYDALKHERGVLGLPCVDYQFLCLGDRVVVVRRGT